MLLLTAALLAVPCRQPATAADKDERPFGGPPAPPTRTVEERPFGGPPPKGRGTTLRGDKCRTPQQTCQLEQRQPVGAKCSCPGDVAEGKVVQ
jgi:hypothetical protein